MSERWTVTLIAWARKDTVPLTSGDPDVDRQVVDVLLHLGVQPTIAVHGESWVAMSFVIGASGEPYGEVSWGGALGKAAEVWMDLPPKAGLDGFELVRLELCQGEVRPNLAPPGADPEQAWYWSPEWLEGQAAAERDLAEGRYTRYLSTEEFLASIEE